MFKLLLKKSFKNLTKNKLFTGLLFLLIFISGFLYTILMSASNAFKKSYNDVIDNGKLHDFVIKENFKPSANSKLQLGIVDKNGSIQNISKKNIDNYKKQYGNNYVIKIKAKTNKGSFDIPKINNFEIKLQVSANQITKNEFQKIKDTISEYKNKLEYIATGFLSKTFTNEIGKIYSNEVTFKETHSLSVSSGSNSFKVVRFNDVKGINELIINDGSKEFTKESSIKDMEEALKYSMLNSQDYIFNNLKGYKITATSPTESKSIVDPSSYQAVISPGYANVNGKKSISPTDIQKILKSYKNNNKDFIKELSTDKTLKEKYSKNLIWVDNTPFLIIGIGTTPDFSYPIIDPSHPTINTKTEAIVFVNQRGYERIYDAFRGNYQENYISGKFKKNVSDKRKNEIRNQIELIARGKLPQYKLPISSWPQDIKIVTKWNDKNDQLLLTQERVVFLDKIQHTIRTISIFTTTLLMLFISSVIFMILQSMININKKQFATMIAMGTSKIKIALSEAIVFSGLIMLATSVAYFSGFFTQFLVIDAFSNYWTLPTYENSFSLFAFLIVMVIPTLFLVPLIISVVLISLRHPLPKMLNNSTEKSNKLLVRIISNLKFIGVIQRYAIALTTKNIVKISLVFVTLLISMSALIIGMASIGKVDYAYSQTVKINNYKFAVNLDTPTKEGGQYGLVRYPSINNMDFNETYGNSNTKDLSKAHWHVPSSNDASYALPKNIKGYKSNSTKLKTSSNYLKNKFQSKVLLKNINGLSIKPWDIAKKLMPENQLNITNKDYEEITSNKNLKPKVSLKLAINNHLNNVDIKSPYILSYNQVIVDQNDETYTYIDSFNGDEHLNIMGVKANTKMINIKGYLSTIDKIPFVNDELPIIINKYISKKDNLDIGSIIKLEVRNDSTRNFKNHKKHIINAKVVGIINTYDEKGIFTTQKQANNILGLTNGFNGVYTKNEKSALLNSLPLYSESGIYLATDTITGAWNNILNNVLNSSNIWKYKNKIASNADEFIKKYSSTPLSATIKKVQWTKMDEYTFKNISTLTSFIIESVEIMSILLAIIFTIIITSLLVKSNTKKIATLWTMGYRKKEIGRIFLSTYIIPIILSIAISTAIAIASTIGMSSFIIEFGHVLIPISVKWWMPLASGLIILTLIATITYGNIWKIKNNIALSAFKGD